MQTKERPQISLRPAMRERLDRLHDISGLAKVEILDQALEAIEPRIVQASKSLKNKRAGNNPAN